MILLGIRRLMILLHVLVFGSGMFVLVTRWKCRTEKNPKPTYIETNSDNLDLIDIKSMTRLLIQSNLIIKYLLRNLLLGRIHWNCWIPRSSLVTTTLLKRTEIVIVSARTWRKVHCLIENIHILSTRLYLAVYFPLNLWVSIQPYMFSWTILGEKSVKKFKHFLYLRRRFKTTKLWNWFIGKWQKVCFLSIWTLYFADKEQDPTDTTPNNHGQFVSVNNLLSHFYL